MGMKVAAISTLCADYRVFDAMWNAGTYCPYNASIGLDAKNGWLENQQDVPKGSLVFKGIEEKEKLKLTEEQGESNGWKVFFAIASFMLVPLL